MAIELYLPLTAVVVGIVVQRVRRDQDVCCEEEEKEGVQGERDVIHVTPESLPLVTDQSKAERMSEQILKQF